MDEDCSLDPYFCYRTDLGEDLIANAECLLVALGRIQRSAHAWKWAVIAADLLASTALVLYLNDTSGTGALDSKSKRTWLELVEGKLFEKTPDRRIMDLGSLLSTAQSMPEGGWRAALALPDVDATNVLALHAMFRNEFVHFKPDGLSVLTDGLAELIFSCVNLAETALARRHHYWDSENREHHWTKLVSAITSTLLVVIERVRVATIVGNAL